MNRLEEIKRKRRKRKRIILYIRIYTSLFLGILLLAGLITFFVTDNDKLKIAVEKLAFQLSNWEEPQKNLQQYAERETEPEIERDGEPISRTDGEKGIKSEQNTNSIQESEENMSSAQASDDKSKTDKGNETSFYIDTKHINSPYAILINLDNGNVVSENNADDKVYPASMTKIMTAILAIENIPDLNNKIDLPADIFKELFTEDASVAGFEPGEEVSAMDLFYGVLLPSGAECCLTLAKQVSGSEDNFAVLMNKKAKELGMKNTHFCNSTGLHNKEHYTTVRDMALLLNYALQSDTFRDIFTSSRHSIKPTNKHPEGFTFVSTMFKSMDHTDVPNGQILGGKTGYTDEAGLCLASLAEIDGTDYILVTAGADGNHETEQYHITDAFSVYDQIGETVVKRN